MLLHYKSNLKLHKVLCTLNAAIHRNKGYFDSQEEEASLFARVCVILSKLQVKMQSIVLFLTETKDSNHQSSITATRTYTPIKKTELLLPLLLSGNFKMCIS